MADKVTSVNNLKLLAGFADEDDRTITLPEPRDSLTAADINAVGAKAIGVLIGDRYGATFTRFKEATYVTGTRTELDLTTS